jgi:hypothetical protein
MTDILSIETIYGIGTVLLTMAVLAPVVLAGPPGRPGSGSYFPGARPRNGGAWRLLEAAPPRPDPARSEDPRFALNLEFSVSRLDRSAIDAHSVS